jgi:hypothetical protein
MTYLVLVLVVAAMAAVVVFWAFGLRHGWAAWPFIVAWGLAALAALFMSAVGVCEDAAGACTSPERMDAYQAALPSLLVLLVAGALLLVRNDAVRRVGFPALTTVGVVLVALRLLDDEQRFLAVILFALVVAGAVLEVLARTRVTAAARTTAG